MLRQIKPSNNNGSIRLRWTHQGRRYSLNLTGLTWSNPVHQAQASSTAAHILADISSNKFDTTLNCYRLETTTGSRPGVSRWASSGSTTTGKGCSSLLEAFDSWLEAHRNQLSSKSIDHHYYYIRQAIVKGSLFDEGLSPYTHNNRLRVIKKVCEWSKFSNPYINIKAKRKVQHPVKVFNNDELKAILKACQSIDSYYVSFLKLMMITGLRIGEAIALQWNQVEQDYTLVVDSTVVFNRPTGKFVRQQHTKNRTVRELRSNELTALLNSFVHRKKGYIFHTSTGNHLYPSYVRERIWYPSLELAGLARRPIHTLRHTALSMMLKAGLTAVDVAYIAGHKNSTMIEKTYGHIIGKPELPELMLQT